MHRAVSLVALLLLLAGLAAAQVPPTLTLSYDEGIDGVGLTGRIAGAPEAKPVLVPGRTGRALKSGPETGYVNYLTAGVLNPAGGTVEMWVCPVDWRPAEEKFHVFFEARGEGALYLYKFFLATDLLMMACDHVDGPYTSRTFAIREWQPGEWHHIAGTWSPAGVMCYVDGKPAGKTPTHGNLPRSFGPAFRIGDNPWQFARTTSSLIDDVRIYDRALTPGHIAAHHAGNTDYAVPFDPAKVAMDYAIDPVAGQVRVSLDIAGADVEDESLRMQVAIATPGAALPADAAEAQFRGGQAAVTLPLPSRTPGAYEVVARLLMAGRQAAELRRELAIPKTDWLGNRIGLEDKVLPPWTPLRVSASTGQRVNGSAATRSMGQRANGSAATRSTGQRVNGSMRDARLAGSKPLTRSPIDPLTSSGSKPLTRLPVDPLTSPGVVVGCWGRQYRFAPGGLPAQITSAGQALLARPVALRLSRAGKPVAVRPSGLRLVKAAPTRAELLGTTTIPAGGAQRRLTVKTTLEYDGLALFTVTCDRPETLLLDGLRIEIAVPAPRALYRHRFSGTYIPLSGSLPAGQGVVDKTAFVPFAWLGDNDRGLFWMCESDEMWPNGQAENAVEILRRGKEVVLRLNVLAKGQKLPPNWRLVFGLQGTPVKPIPRDWRKWRLTPARNATVELLWPMPRPDSLRYFGFPEAANPDLFRGIVGELHARKVKVVPYVCLTYAADSTPEWRFFRQHWAMGGKDPSSYDAGWNHSFDQASPVAKGYADFITWRIKEFTEAYRMDGIYHDQTHPYMSSNVASGVGYVRDGRRHSSFPILGYRELYRRCYAVMKSLGRETFTQGHMSGKMMLPVLAYEDSYLDGEHFRGVVKDEIDGGYTDLIALDHFRAEYMGRQWGLMPFFLPELTPDGSSRKVEPTRAMMALLMIHDVTPWPLFCNVDVLNQAWAALDTFGYVDSGFVPYFDPVPPATTAMKDVYASAYKRRDGRALLVVANLGKVDREGEVRLDIRRLGLPLSKVVSWPDKTPLVLTGDRVRLAIPRQGYRMVVLYSTQRHKDAKTRKGS